MKPASAAPCAPAFASTSSGPALRKVCSLSMIRSTATAKPEPRASVNSGSRLASTSTSTSASGAGSATCGRRRLAPQPARERPRHHGERHDRGGCHPERHRVLALGDPDGDSEREQAARARLHQHEAAVQAEAVVAGQEAAGEVAGRVGQHGHDQDPVERVRAAEEIVLDRTAQGQCDHHEQHAQRELDRRRHAQVLAAGHAARVAVGDGARQQLLHRPVEHRDGDEHSRPQQRDVPVLVLRQRMAGQREVGEGDQPGDADPHREDRGAAAVAARARWLSRHGRAASSRGTASEPVPRCRTATGARRTPAWSSGSRDRACCRAHADTRHGRR